MPISVTCKGCGKTLKAKDTLAGKKVKCPGCSTALTIPAPEAEVLDAEAYEAPADDEFGNMPDEYDMPAADDAAETGRRPCPACAESIPVKAAKCRFCGEVFDKKLRLKSKKVDPDVVRQFRRQVHGLGGVWIAFGCIALPAGIAMASGAMNNANVDNSSIGIVVAMVGIAWLGLGICTCLKQLWAIYAGLVLSSFGIIGNIVSKNFVGVAILGGMVASAYKAISLAKQMREAGIPLTAKP